MGVRDKVSVRGIFIKIRLCVVKIVDRVIL